MRRTTPGCRRYLRTVLRCASGGWVVGGVVLQCWLACTVMPGQATSMTRSPVNPVWHGSDWRQAEPRHGMPVGCETSIERGRPGRLANRSRTSSDCSVEVVVSHPWAPSAWTWHVKLRPIAIWQESLLPSSIPAVPPHSPLQSPSSMLHLDHSWP